MTEEQAIQRMWEDIRFRNLSNSTYKNYTRNICTVRIKNISGIW